MSSLCSIMSLLTPPKSFDDQVNISLLIRRNSTSLSSSSWESPVPMMTCLSRTDGSRGTLFVSSQACALVWGFAFYVSSFSSSMIEWAFFCPRVYSFSMFLALVWSPWTMITPFIAGILRFLFWRVRCMDSTCQPHQMLFALFLHCLLFWKRLVKLFFQFSVSFSHRSHKAGVLLFPIFCDQFSWHLLLMWIWCMWSCHHQPKFLKLPIHQCFLWLQ